MNIAFFIPEFPSLSQTFVLNQITGLIDLGHKIDIFANRASGNSKIHHDVFKYNLLNNTYYHLDFVRSKPKSITYRYLKGFYLFLKYLPKHPLCLLKSLNFFKYWKKAISLDYLYRIIPFLDKPSYDIIHCHFGPLGNYALFLKELNVIKGKIVTSFHGYDLSTLLTDQNKNIYDKLFVNGDLFLPISNYWRDELLRLGCKENKIIVHRMGINTHIFKYQPEHHKNRRVINILSVARLVEKKGIKYGILAVSKLLKHYPDIYYQIVGDGPLKKDLENTINLLNISKNVRLLGSMNQDEVRSFMIDSDIFLAPSITASNGDQEGIPVVLMEASALCLPVVSSFHSGIPELIENNVSGFLSHERDIDSIYDNLSLLLENPDLRYKMGCAGRKKVENNYDIQKLNRDLVEHYKGLLL